MIIKKKPFPYLELIYDLMVRKSTKQLDKWDKSYILHVNCIDHNTLALHLERCPMIFYMPLKEILVF